MATVHIKSVESSVYINGVYIGMLEKDNNFCLDIECSDCFDLSLFYDQRKPVVTKINLAASDKRQNNIKIIPYINYHFDILVTPSMFDVSLPVKELSYKEVDNTSIGVYQSNTTYISIYRAGNLIHNIITDEYTEASIEKIEDNYCVILENTNKKHAVILNKELDIIFDEDFSEISHENNTISILTPVKDLLRHAKVCKIGADGKKEFIVYLEKNVSVSAEKLVPLAFLQCIQNKDYKKAQSFLHSSLQSSANKIKGFFGKIQNIFYNPYNNGQHNFTIETAECLKSYTFVIDDQKIQDIIEESF